eukprot:759359-Hanusia_phi.AAC.4
MNPDDVDTIIDACLYGNVARFLLLLLPQLNRVTCMLPSGTARDVYPLAAPDTPQVVAVDSTLDLRWCRVALFAHHPIPAVSDLLLLSQR